MGIPVIYCNDNFGRWRSDFQTLVEHCLQEKCLGEPLARALRPGAKDYFVLKPRHSAFYCTTLEPLLMSLKVERLVVTWVAADICVLFTAHDAHVRGYEVLVPEDCVASNSAAKTNATLGHLRESLQIRTEPWIEMREFEPARR